VLAVMRPPACKIVAVTLPPALERSLLIEAASICRSMPVQSCIPIVISQAHHRR
jgi:hypothetical protein